MSNFNLSKKLKPARKAWKSLQNQLHPNFVKAITTSIKRTVAPFIRPKFLSLTRRAPPHSRRHLHHHRHIFHPSFSAIYVDELLRNLPPKRKQDMAAESRVAKSVHKPGPNPTAASHDAAKIYADGEMSSAAMAKKGKSEIIGESCKCSDHVSDKWKIPLLPRFRGVDERADEFIAKIRNDMKLEREQSILEFEEMLKRSA